MLISFFTFIRWVKRERNYYCSSHCFFMFLMQKISILSFWTCYTRYKINLRTKRRCSFYRLFSPFCLSWKALLKNLKLSETFIASIVNQKSCRQRTWSIKNYYRDLNEILWDLVNNKAHYLWELHRNRSLVIVGTVLIQMLATGKPFLPLRNYVHAICEKKVKFIITYIIKYFISF